MMNINVWHTVTPIREYYLNLNIRSKYSLRYIIIELLDIRS